jgi:hypothetical protein
MVFKVQDPAMLKQVKVGEGAVRSRASKWADRRYFPSEIEIALA